MTFLAFPTEKGFRKILREMVVGLPDCRAIHNPGLYEPYKTLTGMDEPVAQFLEEQSEIASFLDAAYSLVDNMVNTYLNRGFTHAQICFGCTGGQHRSVYSAEHMAQHLAEKFNVHVRVNHTMLNKNYVIPPAMGN